MNQNIQVNISQFVEGSVFYGSPVPIGSEVRSYHGCCIGGIFDGRPDRGAGPAVNCVHYRGNVGGIYRGPPYEDWEVSIFLFLDVLRTIEIKKPFLVF